MIAEATFWLKNFLTKHVVVETIVAWGFFSFFLTYYCLGFLLSLKDKKEFGREQKSFQLSPKKEPKNFLGKKLYRLYKRGDFKLPFSSFVLFIFLLLVVLPLLFVKLFSPVLAFLFVAISYLIFVTMVKMRERKKQNRLTEQLPFMLDTLSGFVQAGYSLPQAIQATERELEQPLQTYWRKVVKRMNYNWPLDRALEDVQKDLTDRELRLIFNVLAIQNRSGGDLAHILQRVSLFARQKNKLQRDIEIFTSQGRMSGLIIVLLWPISAILFYLINPDYVRILFVTSVGKSLLLFSFALEAIGFYLIWKIIRIKI